MDILWNHPLVVGVNGVDAEGSPFALKGMPIVLSKGPSLWRYWLSVPEDDRIKGLLPRGASVWTVPYHQLLQCLKR